LRPVQALLYLIREEEEEEEEHYAWSDVETYSILNHGHFYTFKFGPEEIRNTPKCLTHH